MDGCVSWKLCLTHKCVRFWQETEIIPLIKYKSFRKVFSLVSLRFMAARFGDVPTLAHSTWMSWRTVDLLGHFLRLQLAPCPLCHAPWHSPPALPLLQWDGLKLPAACDVVALLSVTRPAWSAGNLPTVTLHNRFYYHLFAHSHSAVFSNNRSQGRMTPVISQCGSFAFSQSHTSLFIRSLLCWFWSKYWLFQTYSLSELLFLIKGPACRDNWFTGSFVFFVFCAINNTIIVSSAVGSSCKNEDEGTHGFSLDPVNNTYAFIGGFCHVCLMTWLCREI